MKLSEGEYQLALKIARRYASTKDEADDLAHEALAKVLASSSFDGSNFSGYIARTMENIVANRWRRRSLLEEKLARGASDFLHHPVQRRGSQDEMEDTMSLPEALRQLDALPVKYRLVFIFHRMLRMPLRHVAKILSLPYGTAQSRAYRADTALKFASTEIQGLQDGNARSRTR